MSQQTEKDFEQIAEKALNEMARVEASVGEYQSGLKTMIELAKTALQASKEMDGDNEDDDPFTTADGNEEG